MSYPKNQVVKFDTPKLGLGLFKKNYLGRFLELKERAGSSMSTVSRLCSAPPLQRNKYKYDVTDTQWIDIESVICIIALSFKSNSNIYTLEENDRQVLDEFVSKTI
jgi:hypothetical protein